MPAIVWPRPSRSATSPLRSSKNSRRLSESLGKRSAATAIASATWLCALRNSGSFAFWTSDCRRNRSARSARGSACSLVSRARSEEHTSELQSLMRISYAVFCLKKKKNKSYNTTTTLPDRSQKEQQLHIKYYQLKT